LKVSINFDDGLNNTYHAAFPIMEKYGFHGTVCPITDALIQGLDPHAWGRNDEKNYGVRTRSMTLEELRDLHNHGWEIGGHTKTHCIFTEATLDKVEEELCESTRFLKDCGFNPLAFAYPGGFFTSETKVLVKKYYRCARLFDGGFRLNTQPYDLYKLHATPVNDFPPQAQIDYESPHWLIVVNHVLTDSKGFEAWLRILQKHDVEIVTFKDVIL